MKRRILTMILALCLILSLLPVQTLAQEEEAAPAAEPAAEETQAPAEEEPAEEIAPEEPAEEPAVQAEAPAAYSQLVTASWVNPLYEDLVDPEPIVPVQRPAPRLASSTLSQGALRLGSNMRERYEVIELYCRTDNYPELSDEEFQQYLNYIWQSVLLMAFEPIRGMGEVGDYLAIHISNVEGSIGYDDSDPETLYVLLSYEPEYLTTKAQEDATREAAIEITNMINTTPEFYDALDYEKLLAVYEYMTQNIEFDQRGLNNSKDKLKNTAYGALVEKSAVGPGFAAAFYLITMELNLGENYDSDCHIIVEDAENPHAWNTIMINGIYYCVDAAWDAKRVQNGEEYAYFLKCNETFAVDHTPAPAFLTAEFLEKYPPAPTDYDTNYLTFGSYDGVRWVLTADGVLSFSGTGVAKEVKWVDGWVRYKEYIKSVQINEGITAIEEKAFWDCGFTSISLPNSLEEIRANAFASCTGLTSIRIPANVKSIGYMAFNLCENLEEVLFDERKDHQELVVSGYAFSMCKKLKKCEMPDSTTAIGINAFLNAGLEEITIPKSVTGLGSNTFKNCTNLSVIRFQSYAPVFGDINIFQGVTATVYYPTNRGGWTEDVRQNYGGNLTWEGYEAEFEKFSIEYANMTLGNSLAMNFAFPQHPMEDWEGAYALIAKTYADGRGTKVITIPESQWGQTVINGRPYYTLKFDGIAAKEMADEIYITVYSGDRKPISNNWEDSVRSYAMRTLNNPDTTDDSARVIVDMLHYGAAAQLNFNYDVENLATSKLTPQQAALATPSAWAEDYRVKGENYLGTQLRLESQIMLRMAFSGVTKDMTAVITYTDHYDRPQRITVPGSDLELTGSTAVVTIDEIVVADARQDVTVQILDSDGNVVASATDSVASYIARMRQEDEVPLYEAILKFADSAHQYFHPKQFEEELQPGDKPWE